MAFQFHRVGALLAVLLTPATAAEVHDFRYTAVLANVDGQALSGFEIAGELVLGADAFGLSGLSCTATGGEPAGPELAAVCSAIAGGTGWRRDARGTLEALRVPHEVSAAAGTLLAALAAQVAITLDVGEEWLAEEPDAMGVAQAYYRRAGARVERRRATYAWLADGTGLRRPEPGEVALVAHARMRLEAGRLETLEAEEVVRRQAALTDLPAFEARATLRLDRRAAGTEPVARLGLWRAPHTPPAPGADRRARAQGLSGGRDAAELRAALGEGRLATEAERRALLGLAAVYAAGRVATDEIAAYCRAHGPRGCKLSLMALGAAGTAQAQLALRDLFDLLDDGTLAAAELRREAVRALGTRLGGRMTAETRAWLTGLLADPAYGRQAAYGLGSEAFRARGTPAGQAALAPLLEPWGTDPLRRLRAFGNAGAPEALPEIGAALAGDEIVARTAVEALRRMQPSAAVEALFLIALEPARAALHRPALDSLGFRPEGAALRARLTELAAGSGPVARRAQRVLTLGDAAPHR